MESGGALSLVQICRDTGLSLVDIIVLLHQLSYAIKNQLKAPKAPSRGLWDEMPSTRGISCLSIALFGIS